MADNASPDQQRTDQLAQARSLAAALPPLMAEAERVANTVEQGMHGRRRTGTGESFWQYRHYSSTDSASAIDWRQSARSDALFVRENEWDAAQSAWLWCDRSASMRFRSNRKLVSKQDRALVLSLALTSLLTRGGERVAAFGSGEPAIAGRAGFARVADHLMAPPAPELTGLPPQIALPRYATAILISDFLEPPDLLDQHLNTLAEAGVTAHLLQVLDPAEVTLPYDGRTEFKGIKESMSLTVGRAEDLRATYKKRLAGLQNRLADLSHHRGWSFAVHQTDQSATTALLSLYGLIGGQLEQVAAGDRP